MTVAGVSVSVEEVVREIEAIDRQVRNAAPAMSTMANMLVAAVDDEIQTKGRGRWPAFAESTLKRGRAGGMLLQNTGLLANIQPDSGPDFAEAWSPAPYTKRHVTGTKHMPKRNPFDIELDKVLEEMAAVYLERVAL